MLENIKPFLLEDKNYSFGKCILTHKDDNICFTFGDFSILVLKSKLISMIEKESGRVTIGDYIFTLPKKKKSESYVRFDILDKKTKNVLYTSDNVWSPHHNTDPWYMLIPFINKAETVCTISVSQKRNRIGFNIFIIPKDKIGEDYPYDDKWFSYIVDIESEYNHSDTFKYMMKIYQERVGKDIIVQSLKDIEEYMGPINNIFNMDDIISKEDMLELSKKDYIDQNIGLYDDDPVNINATLTRFYISEKHHEISILDKYKSALMDLNYLKKHIIFPLDISVDTKYEKDIKLLDPKYIISSNEDKLIELVNSKQYNFTWGSKENMLPIDDLLYHAINKGLIKLIKAIHNNMKKVRGNDFIFTTDKTLIFLNVALETQSYYVVEAVISLYKDSENMKKLYDELPHINRIYTNNKIHNSTLSIKELILSVI